MLKFTVLHSEWFADGERYEAGDHQIDKPPAELVTLAAHAHSAGAIDVTEGLDLAHVQTQDEAEAALTEAMGDWVDPVRDPDAGEIVEPGHWTGPWQESQNAQAALDKAAKAAELAELEEVPA